MSAKKRLFHRIRLIYRPSSTLLKCAVLAAIVLSTVALLTLRYSIRENRQRQEELALQAGQLTQENRTLAERIAELGTVESVKRIAMEVLGLVDPDSRFFTPSDSTISPD